MLAMSGFTPPRRLLRNRRPSPRGEGDRTTITARTYPTARNRAHNARMDREPFSLDAAWAQLGELVSWLVSLFGKPVEIALRWGLVKRSRQEILDWLAPVEALARRLLLIEAAQTQPPNFIPKATPRDAVASARRDAPQADLDAESATWRVVFHLGALARGRAKPSTGPMTDLPLRPNAWPLAKRLEALLRLTQDRAGVLARLARRMAAHAAEFAAPYKRYPHAGGPCASALAEASGELDRVLAARADTS